jgi:hypothetical protein
MEVSGQLYTAAAFTTGKMPLVPIGKEALWGPESVWTLWRREKSRILLPRSLYRLRYEPREWRNRLSDSLNSFTCISGQLTDILIPILQLIFIRPSLSIQIQKEFWNNESFRRLVGRLGRGIGASEGLLVHVTITQKTCHISMPDRDSKPRSHNSGSPKPSTK